MWIDTHCHLDAAEFAADRAAVTARANTAGVRCIIIPAVAQHNFSTVATLAHQHPHHVYALGIHPISVDQAKPTDLQILRRTVADYSERRAVCP